MLLAALLLQSTVLTEALVISGVSRGGRIPFGTDAVQAQMASGTWVWPKEGGEISFEGNSRQWRKIQAGNDGWLQDRALGGGYAAMTHESASGGAAILRASGHSLVFVNGEPRGGDPYQYGYVDLPVRLKQGTNQFLFSAGRGRLRAEIVNPPKPVYLNTGDPTLPDLIPSDKEPLWGAVIVVNATDKTLADGTIEATVGGKAFKTKVWAVPAMSFRKVGFRIPAATLPEGEHDLRVNLMGQDEKIVKIRSRAQGQTYRRTFVSRIDGSVQYFAVVPQTNPKPGSALVMTCHGASVEAQGQADAYKPKSWCTIVAPTNRRPFGFDWEEVGRLDFLEVMEEAKRLFKPDANRVFLTGHSMGGHGTWQIGAQHSDLFAGIAPSAGWISFYTYAGGQKIAEPTPMEAIVQRSANASDTLYLTNNFLNYPIYILHGDADDNVPVGQARQMKQVLEGIKHPSVSYHEEKGAGHWWGNQCVDWPGIFELFEKSVRKSFDSLDFTTVSPSVSASHAWLQVVAQQKRFEPSRVQLSADRAGQKIIGTTSNVQRMTFNLHEALGSARSKVILNLDGTALEVSKAKAIVLQKGTRGWFVANDLRLEPVPFKSVFNDRFCLVYGTGGTAEENAWMKSKAIFDAETFGYRGNGSVDVYSDSEFKAGERRNVILYGNSDTNGAWKRLISRSPIKVGRSGILVGTRAHLGSKATLFLTRADNGQGLVAVVGGTDLAGYRLTTRVPYFTSGVQLPDYVIFGPEVFTQGSKAVDEAGYFELEGPPIDFVAKN
ncbi:MAG TPA: prolyl oligopeptidase family serine peptidase [Fimbriimonadaceae bacterium]|nr:prolyl oligopeptidase family serine peptidase [Fimbriimonadaceae bacterium]